MGRIVALNLDRADPKYRAFLMAQELQAPSSAILRIDQFYINHIDEVVSFLPSPRGSYGWKMVVSSPRAGLELLESLVAEGRGDQRFFDEDDFPGGLGGSNTAVILRALGFSGDPVSAPPALLPLASLTINRLFSVVPQIKAEWLAEEQEINAVANSIAATSGLAPTDIVRLPVLINRTGYTLLPNVTNMAVAPAGLLIPRPYGPRDKITGRSWFGENIREKLVSAGAHQNIHWVDTMLNGLHRSGGEVHCSTNALRKMGELPAQFWYNKVERGPRGSGTFATLDVDCCPEGQTWDAEVQACKAACPGGSAAGNSMPFRGAFELGARSGEFTFSYQTYSVKERIKVLYERNTIFDTGCVGASGRRRSGTVAPRRRSSSRWSPTAQGRRARRGTSP